MENILMLMSAMQNLIIVVIGIAGFILGYTLGFNNRPRGG